MKVASVIFLVDGKLVLLQPVTTDTGDLKYDMRRIADNVEYYALMREQVSNTFDLDGPFASTSQLNGNANGNLSPQGISDSLWFFNGTDMNVWLDVNDVLRSASIDTARSSNSSIRITVDFYPLSVLIRKGVLLGIEAELIQRRAVNFAMFRLALRVSVPVHCSVRY